MNSMLHPAKLGPAAKRAALLARPDCVYPFLVRASGTGLRALADRVAALSRRAGAVADVLHLPLVDGVAAPLRVSDAALIARAADVSQVWYLHPRLAPLYLNIIKALAYGMSTAEKPAVASISLGPPADLMPLPDCEDEPMHLATRRSAEAGFLPVMAVGNYGRADGANDGLVNAWARPPWVIAVGRRAG